MTSVEASSSSARLAPRRSDEASSSSPRRATSAAVDGAPHPNRASEERRGVVFVGAARDDKVPRRNRVLTRPPTTPLLSDSPSRLGADLCPRSRPSVAAHAVPASRLGADEARVPEHHRDRARRARDAHRCVDRRGGMPRPRSLWCSLRLAGRHAFQLHVVVETTHPRYIPPRSPRLSPMHPTDPRSALARRCARCCTSKRPCSKPRWKRSRQKSTGDSTSSLHCFARSKRRCEAAALADGAIATPSEGVRARSHPLSAFAPASQRLTQRARFS